MLLLWFRRIAILPAVVEAKCLGSLRLRKSVILTRILRGLLRCIFDGADRLLELATICLEVPGLGGTQFPAGDRIEVPGAIRVGQRSSKARWDRQRELGRQPADLVVRMFSQLLEVVD